MITDKGAIKTNLVINAAGMWASRLAAMVGVPLPTTPVDHQHITLKAVAGHEFPKNTPCLRDPDNLVYMREEQGGLVIGGYEPNPPARWIDGAPWEHGNATLPHSYQRFEMLLEGAIRRIPFLKDAGIIDITCHPGAYTPDCQPMLGPISGARGMWMLAGMSLNGYGGAGGMGKLLAEWIVMRRTALGAPVWERRYDTGQEERIARLREDASGIWAVGRTFDALGLQLLVLRKNGQGL